MSGSRALGPHRAVRLFCAAFAALFVVVAAGSALAHDNRPLYIELEEREPAVFSVSWRVPPSVPDVNRPEVTLPEVCTIIGAERAMGPVTQTLWQCPDGFGEGPLIVEFPVLPPSMSTLVRVSWLSGETRTVLAEPGQGVIALPSAETASRVAGQYLALGVRHILEGYDHLLFLLCLMLIARTGRRILITVTGFTLAHSVTLALSALGIVRVPIPAVEAAIALSIVFVAVELARNRVGTLTHRYPILVSSSFGLLHGFGFAAVLGETGLPQTEIPVALLFFNLGVELGQVAFVLAALLAIGILVQASRGIASLASRPAPSFTVVERLAVYTAGILAAYWMFDRVAGFWT